MKLNRLTMAGKIGLLACLLVSLVPSAFAAAQGDGSNAAAAKAASPAPVSIALGATHGLAALGDGAAAGWGTNKYGQVGDGTVNVQYVAKRVVGLPNVKQVAAGLNASFALDASGGVWGWGEGYSKMTGDPAKAPNPMSPPAKLDIDGAVAITAGMNIGAALLRTGEAKAWYLAPEADRTLAVHYLSVQGLGNVKNLYLYSSRLYAVLKDGSVKAVELYQYDDGRFRTAGELKVEKLAVANALAIGAYNQELFVLQQNGTVLRYDSAKKKSAKIAGLDHIVDVKMTYDRLLALRSNGTVWTLTVSGAKPGAPAQVKGPASIVAIAGSYSHTGMALQKSGKLFAWGDPERLAGGTGSPVSVADTDTPGEWLMPLAWQANGKPVAFYASASAVGGKLYVPFTSVFDALGIRGTYAVSPPDPNNYNATFATWSFEYKGQTIVYKIANPVEATVNGKPIAKPAADSLPRTVGNMTQFPLEYICRTFGIAYSWDRTTGVVTLGSPAAA